MNLPSMPSSSSLCYWPSYLPLAQSSLLLLLLLLLLRSPTPSCLFFPLYVSVEMKGYVVQEEFFFSDRSNSCEVLALDSLSLTAPPP